MHIFSLFLLLTMTPSAQALSPNVCAVQNDYPHSVDSSKKQQEKTQVIVVSGRAVFSPRGFWVLSEPGCAGIPIAEILESVKPKPSFELIKDENYQELQKVRDRSRHDTVFVEVEGRLDRIGKKARDARNGSAAIHISKYDYKLVLRRVREIQIQ